MAYRLGSHSVSSQMSLALLCSTQNNVILIIQLGLLWWSSGLCTLTLNFNKLGFNPAAYDDVNTIREFASRVINYNHKLFYKIVHSTDNTQNTHMECIHRHLDNNRLLILPPHTAPFLAVIFLLRLAT